MEIVVRLVIPFILLGLTGFAKKLSRGQRGYTIEDWFLGVELTLASLSSALTQLLDCLRTIGENQANAGFVDSLKACALFTPIMLFALFFVLSIQRDWERRRRSLKRTVWLGGISNLIGVGSMACFLLFVKV